MSTFQPLPGFRDFLPHDCALRDRLFDLWRRTAQSFGFDPYDGPPLEPLDLYKKKSGEEIVHQLYNFTDKGGREVALRPEMTPTLARMAAAAQRHYKKPLKWYAIPQLFRYERTQRGRLREHFQWNCDIIGEPGLGAEAELIALMISAFRSMGLTAQDVEIRLSDRQFWKDYLERHHLPDDQHYAFFQAIDKIGREPEEVTRTKLGPRADEVFHLIHQGATSPRLDELLAHLDAYGGRDFVRVDLGIVRGLAYYTGIVFEAHDRAGQFRAIAGGGRYDDLLRHLGGVDLPALGFGMGDVVITEILRAKNLLAGSAAPHQLALIIPDETLRADALRLACAFRAAGYRVDVPLGPAKVGRQFEAAQDRGYSMAIIVDAQWKTHGTLSLKNLATRTQSTIRLLRDEAGHVTGWTDVPPDAS